MSGRTMPLMSVVLKALWSVVDGPDRDTRMWRRVLVTMAALMVLLWQARSGTSTSRLVLLAAVFVVAATMWLHAQYVDDLDGESWWLHPIGSISLLVLGLVFLLSGLKWQPAFSLGVISFYLGVAFLMTWARQQTQSPSVVESLQDRRKRQLWWRVGALAAGGALSVAGLLLLGNTDLVAFGALLLVGSAAVVVMPAFVLLGEWLVRDWMARSGAFLGIAMGAATAGLVLLVGVSWWLGSGVVAIGELVLVVLIAAALAGTHVDFVGVMLVAALLGVTAQPAASPDRLVTTANDGGLSGRVLVALGDSYMSGEGASVFFAGTDNGGKGENQCRQAPTSWSRQLSLLGRFDSMLFLACQGALTQHVLHQDGAPPADLDPDLPRPPTPKVQGGTTRTQLDAAEEELGAVVPDLVVVSVGGNDAGFSGIGAMCLAPGKCDRNREIWDAKGNFAQLAQQLDGVYDEISAQFPSSAVVVIPYPDVIDMGGDCGDLLLTRSEARFVHEFTVGSDTTVGLDTVIRQQAAAHGFYFAADMIDALAAEDLQLCNEEGNTPGLHFLGLRSIAGVAGQRFNPANWIHSSLHPNEKGHDALLHAFSGWYEKTLEAQVAGDAPTRSADGRTYRLNPRTSVVAAAPLAYDSPSCPISEQDEKKDPTQVADIKEYGDPCRTKGKEWIRAQLPPTLVSLNGVVLLLVVGCAAVVSVAGTAWRRKRWAGQATPFP